MKNDNPGQLLFAKHTNTPIEHKLRTPRYAIISVTIAQPCFIICISKIDTITYVVSPTEIGWVRTPWLVQI